MPKFNRRDFLRTVGQGTLAAGLGMGLAEGAWIGADEAYGAEAHAAEGKPVEDVYTREEKTVETDVLVIGGGIAGMFAAIKAGEQGARVVLVNKGYTGRSGQTPFTQCFMVFNPGWGHDLDAWMSAYNSVSEYLNNRHWTESAIRESWDRYQDLLSWGVEFQKDDITGEPIRFSSTPGPIEFLRFDKETFSGNETIMRKQLEKSGVQIMDKIMVTELLKQDGRVVGAVGIPLDSYDTYTFLAKATIMCVGAASFKPAGYPPLVQLTGDGEAMAYRAGAEVLGKEFVDTHSTQVDIPNICARHVLSPEKEAILGPKTLHLGKYDPPRKEEARPKGGGRVNAEGSPLPDRPEKASHYGHTYLDLEFEAHAGRAPIVSGGKEMVGGAALGMSLRKADGIWPASTNCASSVPGLYAAGDALGCMQNGAVYCVLGSSTCGGAHTGTTAGIAAAREALEMGELTVDAGEIARARAFAHAPIQRKGGYSPRWVTHLLQNTMMPYYVSYIKKEDRLKATITLVEFMKEHLVPMLYARDPHELRLAHETRSMVLSAEMRLRSALFRTESRGNHYREDYPRRDDPDWLAWSKIRQEQGKMQLAKVAIPEEEWPDLSIPYEERYPYRYPGE